MRAKKQRSPPRKALRPKGATNKTVPLNVRHYPTHMADSDTSSDGTRKTSPDGLLLDMDGSVVSPKSYLSMPSVKSFPRQVNYNSHSSFFFSNFYFLWCFQGKYPRIVK